MKAETWRDVRTRAAALLPAEIMAAVEDYYSPLETVLTLLQFQDAVSDTADRMLRDEIQRVKPEWSVAATSNPYGEYLDRTVAAQDTARERIKRYLDVSPVSGLLMKLRKRRSRRLLTPF
jgi:hypothetical protein